MDRLFDLMTEQGKALSEQGKTLSAMNQSLTDTKERLFGANGQPGAIGYLHAEHAKLEGEVKVVCADVVQFKSDRRAERAYITGAGAVLALLLKAGLNKIGIHV